MNKLLLIIILLLASIAFSQGMSIAPSQLQQLQMMQGQMSGQMMMPGMQMPGMQMSAYRGMSAAELSAARDMLSRGNMMQTASGIQSQQIPMFEFTDSTTFMDYDSLSLFFRKDTNLTRYEKMIFTRSLPTAFYELQGMVAADYPLKAGDNLELSLWGSVERQLPLVVNNQGNVFVEGVGLVNIGSLTLGAAEKLLTKRLQAVYSGIGQGRISVNLRTMQLSPTKIFVMGAVERPGGYDLPGNANVFLAIYRAGGPSDIGSVRNIMIRRANGDSIKIDLYDFLLKGQKIGEGLLRDGDLVFLPPVESLVKATGAVGLPAIYELKANETLSDLLYFAGGLLPTSAHTVSVRRINEVGAPEFYSPGMVREFMDGKKTFQMQNGDSVFVFTSSFQNKNAVEVVGSVYYPGFYTWTNDMGIKEAVELAGGLSPEAFLSRAIVQRLNADSSFSYLDDDFKNTLGLKLMPNDKVVVLDSRVLKNWRTVSIAGYVKTPQDFEWQDGINALDLIVLCGGFLTNASKDGILIERIVPGKSAIQKFRVPLKKGLSVEHNKNLILEPGDRVVVEIDDSFYEQEIITLTGAFKNPGSYSLAHRGETFKEFMGRIAKLDDMAYIKGGKLFRKDIVKEKMVAVDKAVMAERRLMGDRNTMSDRAFMSGSLTGDGTFMSDRSLAGDRNDKAIGNASAVEPDTTNKSYRIGFDFERVLSGKDKDIMLQANDSIHIPFEMLTVNITGEVTSPGHILWRKGWDIDDYLNAAGGLTLNGDENRIVLTYANGQKIKSARAKTNPDPGSEIFVAYKPTPEPTKWTEIVSAIGSVATTITAVLILVITLK
ncbi:MAG: SLBB domain-containing protein [Fibromonadales bacterium]|nr:SLBB domain-containing protein [Fibromonadales bacterium]